MLTATSGKARRAVSRSYALPFPTGGINARDALTGMSPTDAINLVNVFPEANYGAVRRGYASNTTGLGAAVETLMVWNGSTGTDKIFGAAGTKFWTVAGGASSSVVTGLTNARWQWTNIATAGGQFLVLCNGADPVQEYDGTTWTVPTITGATSSTFVGVTQFKSRLWFYQINSLNLYYLPAQSIAGTVSQFPLGSVFRRGGYITGFGSFSMDAGEGIDDYFCIATNNGEVAMYQGTDPTSANTWSLVGLYSIGRPIGRRCMVNLSGDLGIITQDGITSMKAALQFDRSAGQKAEVTSNIQTLFGTLSRSYNTNFGWQPCVFPSARYLIVNVPAITGTSQSQLVMNTVTGAWTTFVGFNAGCWATANDLLYFGGNAGTVYQADTGFQDNGANINFEIQTSWQMHDGDSNKMFKGVQPVMLTGGNVQYAIGLDVDFSSQAPAGLLNTGPATGMTWPFTWPGMWGGQSFLDARWHSVGAIGTWSSVHVLGATKGSACQVNSFNLIAEQGGVY